MKNILHPISILAKRNFTRILIPAKRGEARDEEIKTTLPSVGGRVQADTHTSVKGKKRKTKPEERKTENARPRFTT